MKNLLIFILLLTLALAASDALLTLSKSSSCLKDLVAQLVRADDCSKLTDQAKTKIALKMSECLLKQMGKPFPSQCLKSSCRLQGDAWSTFTTFYAHVDNLCHFYWETMHHERTEKLIGQLSESSLKAEQVLRENVKETKKVISMQQQIHQTIDESLRSQQRMADLINTSALHITNLTVQIQTFVQSIHRDIDHNYASIRNLLKIINDGLLQVVQVQSYIQSQITSVSGALFFLCQFLIVLFVTSLKKYQTARANLLFTLAIEAGLELTMSTLIRTIISITFFRYIFMSVMIIQLINSYVSQDPPQTIVANSFNTPRLQRAFQKMMQLRRLQQSRQINLSCLAKKVIQKLKDKNSFQEEAQEELMID